MVSVPVNLPRFNPRLVEVSIEPLTYNEGQTGLRGYVAVGEGDQPRPGVILFPDFWGPGTEFASHRATRLAAEGYVVLIADMYGDVATPETREQAGALLKAINADRPAVRRRVVAAMNALRSHRLVEAGKIAAMGYCFGGCCALELCRAGGNPLGAISIHGALDTSEPLQAGVFSGSILILHGAEDPAVPQSDVTALMDELRHAGVDWHLVQFGGARHGFSNPSNAKNPTAAVDYHEKTDRRAQSMVREFLSDLFRSS